VGAAHATAPGALPTGADTGKAVSSAVPLVSEAGGAAALVLLAAGLLFYRRRSSVHGS
jgi:MYXO-CTERM domain-containing protein